MLSYSQLLYFCLNYSLFYFFIAVAWSSIIIRKRSRINIEDGPAEQTDDDAMDTQSSDPHAHLLGWSSSMGARGSFAQFNAAHIQTWRRLGVGDITRRKEAFK